MNRTIIQLVGESGSGKSESAKYLCKYGFDPLEVSEAIWDWASHRGIDLAGRQDYMEAHAQIVREVGKQAMTDAILDSTSDRICIDGSLVPANANFLRTYGVIIALDCSLEIRHPRLMKRRGPLDRISAVDLRSFEEAESRNSDPYTQNTRVVMAAADYHVNSAQPLPWVRLALDQIIAPHIMA